MYSHYPAKQKLKKSSRSHFFNSRKEYQDSQNNEYLDYIDDGIQKDWTINDVPNPLTDTVKVKVNNSPKENPE